MGALRADALAGIALGAVLLTVYYAMARGGRIALLLLVSGWALVAAGAFLIAASLV